MLIESVFGLCPLLSKLILGSALCPGIINFLFWGVILFVFGDRAVSLREDFGSRLIFGVREVDRFE